VRRTPRVDRRSSIVAAMLVLAVSLGGCILDGRKNEPRISNESGVQNRDLLDGSRGR